MLSLACKSLKGLSHQVPKTVFSRIAYLGNWKPIVGLVPVIRGYDFNQVRYYRQASSTPPISQTNPELLLLWHPTKNVGISPDSVSLKSFQKVWWKCPKGVDHEWQSSVRYIVGKDNKFIGCPFCNNRMVSITNSLSTKYPELAAQWHPTKNGSLLPSSVTYTSSKNVWWQCDKDPRHEWKKPISQRANPKTKTQGLCPYCAGIHPETRTLEAVYPEIAKEWNYEKNGDLLPSHISKSSAVRVWWKCSKGHEWQTSVNNRTSSHHSGCPYCNGHSISLEHSLAFLYPELASQWHPTKNGTLTPSQVFPCSDRVVWWLCTLPVGKMILHDDTVEVMDLDDTVKNRGCGREWEESVVNRVTKFKSNHTLVCPDCSATKRHRSSTVTPKKKEQKPRSSKKLKKIRVVNGRNKDDIIIVSAGDYETLIESGAYEPVEEKQNIVMKKVYGKKESPYKRHMTEGTVVGPRQRTVINESPSKKPKQKTDSEEEWLDDMFYDDLAPNGIAESESDDGWSF